MKRGDEARCHVTQSEAFAISLEDRVRHYGVPTLGDDESSAALASVGISIPDMRLLAQIDARSCRSSGMPTPHLDDTRACHASAIFSAACGGSDLDDVRRL